MKVTFLSTFNNGNSEKIRIFFKDIFNNDVQIDLRPGDIVYSQTDHLSNSLKIYSRKGLIAIEEENKPDFLKYYTGYKQEEIDNKHFLFNLQNSLRKETEPSVTKVETPKEKIEKKEDVITIVDKAIEDISNYSLQELTASKKTKKTKKSSSKKGPGRPKKRGPKKGSKNKKSE